MTKTHAFLRYLSCLVIGAVGLVGLCGPARSVEGGLQTYLLGTRDFTMGVVPPPGIYVSHEVTHYRAELSASSIGGLITADADLDLWLNKSVVTAVLPGKIFGGSAGVSLQVPIPRVALDIEGSITDPDNGATLSGNVDGGSKLSLGDIIISPLIGWHAGKWHYAFALTMYLPTGSYDTATIDIAERSVDAANTGKNRFAIDPTLSVTYLDPTTGHEFDIAAGITFSQENEATAYQTGAELHVEATLAQRFGNGWAVGVSGGLYQQLQDDSGAGAAELVAVLNTDELKARFFQIGPVVSYATKLDTVDVSLTAKYFHQFGAERHFEGDVGTIRLNLKF
jgi:hypothetical protein